MCCRYKCDSTNCNIHIQEMRNWFLFCLFKLLRYFIYGLIESLFLLQLFSHILDEKEGKSFAFRWTKFARTRSQLCFFFPPKTEAIRVTAKHLRCSRNCFSLVLKWVIEPSLQKKEKKKRWANTHSYSLACHLVSVWNSMMSVTVSKRCSRCPCCCVELDQMSLLVCHVVFTKNCCFYQKQSFWMLFSLSRAFYQW